MFGRIIGWFLSMGLAFFLGTSVSNHEPSDSELQQKVQEHMDVIIDESAALVDDVIDEVREDEHVKRAKEFADDVEEIVNHTIDDIHEHFDEEESELLEELEEDESEMLEVLEAESETEQA